MYNINFSIYQMYYINIKSDKVRWVLYISLYSFLVKNAFNCFWSDMSL